MKSNYPKPEVGMEVFVVYSNPVKKKVTETIKKIGRKWVEFGEFKERFDKDTWFIDGGNYSSPGTVYPSEQYYLEELELIDEWKKLVSLFSYYSVPNGMTVEKIKEIMKLLELDQ